MKRRTFLKRTAPILALPAVINGMHFSALAQTPGLHRMLTSADGTDNVLVIIQMEGGNDGLNMVIPVESSVYYEQRPTIAITKSEALPISGQPLLRLNPMLEGIQHMFDNGQLAIVNNIGYDNYSLSHFTGTELWNTGSGGLPTEYQTSGWIGRFLADDFPEFPQILPTHPPAVQIRPAVSSVFSLGNSTIGLALTDPVEFHELVTGGPNIIGDPEQDTLPGREWNYIRTINTQAVKYSDVLRNAASKAKNQVQYPGDNPLAESLAIVARLIAGGLTTRVYMVTIGNFDTHGNQRQHQDRLLGMLSPAIKAFMDDLIALSIDHRVVGMTYSEFGRRIRENASGTDHGAAAPHFVFGTPIDGGRVLGGLPDLDSPDDLGNLRHSITFPCYYASVLGPAFSIRNDRMKTILPIGLCDEYKRVQLYQNWTTGIESDYEMAELLACTPNPASLQMTLRYYIAQQGNVELAIYTIAGELVIRPINEHLHAGYHVQRLNVASIPAGTYICRLRTAGITRSTKIIVQH